MSLNIRSAQDADVKCIAKIYNQYVGKNTLDLEQRDSDHFLAELKGLREKECMLVIEQVGVVAGFGILKKYSWKAGYRYTGETSAFLDEKYRGAGLGRQLKTALIERARTLGYKHLVARIMANNTASIQYNLNLGYEVVGIQKRIGFTGSEWVDVVILQLLLD